jgi:hypothetical protein
MSGTAFFLPVPYPNNKTDTIYGAGRGKVTKEEKFF